DARKGRSKAHDGTGRVAEPAGPVQNHLAPIRRVPPEIIASIISFVIEPRNLCVGYEERHSFIKVRLVCQLWRTTSFSTPSLWRTVELDMTELPV
ncbi:hypothetical protein BKA70DRAFT_1047983, partial [Coprinopsis sp. MPI-PUGE-AT-0042]